LKTCPSPEGNPKGYPQGGISTTQEAPFLFEYHLSHSL
jgi:hypothetical protein